ncbi:MAG TPA: HEPN domain-containing protein [Dehalococcoidia bacterium]|nr:HEPN domain-containing protein [Dehalococcoidia bacterium]
MKTPLQTARRWLAQAVNTLDMTRSLFDAGFWAGTCFHAEQTAQLALKAYLFRRGRRFVNIHSIHALAQECGKEDQEFVKLQAYGPTLDRYYLSTRYPDVLPEPAIPFQAFTQQDAIQALEYATEIVALVRSKIPN